MRWALLVAMLWAGSAQAAEWSAADIALEATGAALHVVDYSQTLWMAERGPYEQNPVLGRQPSAGAVTAYFAATLALHVAVAHVLPRPYRTYWQAAWVGLEATCVGHNFSAGVRLSI